MSNNIKAALYRFGYRRSVRYIGLFMLVILIIGCQPLITSGIPVTGTPTTIKCLSP
ncbi:MAG: hypothetical protein WAV05_19175 [Anaerolineales bacterium]